MLEQELTWKCSKFQLVRNMFLIPLWLHDNEQKESLNSGTNCKYNFQVKNSQLKKLHWLCKARVG